jgi:beta-1,4-mannosyltransferase
MARREAFTILVRAARAVVSGRPMRLPKAPPSGPRAAAPAPSRTTPLPGVFTSEARAGLALVSGEDPPLILGYYPTVTTNPYQLLLYDQALEHGIVPVGMRQERQLDELLALQRSGVATALHLHWLHPVMRPATSISEARALGRAFLGRLDAYRSAGGRLVWSVHNVLPHEVGFEAAEAELCGEVAVRADVVHVLAERTADAVAPWYRLPPDRLLHVPMSSYDSVYPDHVPRLEARQRLHLRADELVFLSLGAIRPYKDLDSVLDAWVGLEPGDRRLVIAGPVTQEPGVAALVARARATGGVIVEPRKIPVADMQLFLRAADVAVLPYPGALNSSALMLALTFGLPVIVPAGTGLADEVDPTFAILYDPTRTDGLRDALEGAGALATPAARAAAVAAVADRPPAAISHRFAVALRERLIVGSGEAAPATRER